jgi:hypothetical protein
MSKETDFYTPLKVDWEWFVVRELDRTVAPKSMYLLWDKAGAGWIYWAFLNCDNPKLLLNIDVVSLPGAVEIKVSPEMLWKFGFTQSIGGFRVLAAESGNWTVEYAPGVLGHFGTPFRDRNRCWLENPTDTPIKFNFQAWLILFKKPEEVIPLERV